MGSPPRMRGKGIDELPEWLLDRITPAYAGKSCAWHMAQQPEQDHPRVCGEKDVSVEDAAQMKGSPPRMRGKARKSLVDTRWEGITPAYAGKRVSGTSRNGELQDHPRVCGEKP